MEVLVKTDEQCYWCEGRGGEDEIDISSRTVEVISCPYCLGTGKKLEWVEYEEMWDQMVEGWKEKARAKGQMEGRCPWGN